MIEIEILSSSDPDFLGVWKFHKNSIFIGFPQADICYPGIKLSYAFMVEVLPDAFQVIPHPKLDFWLLNSKRSTQQRSIKKGDHIQIADLGLKIIDGLFQEYRTKKSVLDERLKELVTKEDESLVLISLINKKVKSSENTK